MSSASLACGWRSKSSLTSCIPRKPVEPVTRISSSLFIQRPTSARGELEGRSTMTFRCLGGGKLMLHYSSALEPGSLASCNPCQVCEINSLLQMSPAKGRSRSSTPMHCGFIFHIEYPISTSQNVLKAANFHELRSNITSSEERSSSRREWTTGYQENRQRNSRSYPGNRVLMDGPQEALTAVVIAEECGKRGLCSRGSKDFKMTML